MQRGVEPAGAVKVAFRAEQRLGSGRREEFEGQRLSAAPRFGIGQRPAAPCQRQWLFRRQVADDGIDSQPDHSRPPLCRGRISSDSRCSVPGRSMRSESLTTSTSVRLGDRPHRRRSGQPGQRIQYGGGLVGRSDPQPLLADGLRLGVSALFEQQGGDCVDRAETGRDVADVYSQFFSFRVILFP